MVNNQPLADRLPMQAVDNANLSTGVGKAAFNSKPTRTTGGVGGAHADRRHGRPGSFVGELGINGRIV
jgi:hypothetical protein